MAKSTGMPIKYKKAKKYVKKAAEAHSHGTIRTAVFTLGKEKKTFFNNLNCAFIFDSGSLTNLMTVISGDPNKGLIMMLGSTDWEEGDPQEDKERDGKPTLSVFACTIDRVNNRYNIIFKPDPDDTDGVEHPGIVSLDSDDIGNGSIQFIKK